MRASTFSESKMALAANAIATEGTHEAGWLAAGIGRTTFYAWLRAYPDFADAIRTAEEEYRNSHRANVQRLGYQAFLGYLRGEMTKVTHTRKEVINPLSGQIEQVEEWRTVPCGIPEWAIRRALGSMSELEGLQALAQNGLVEKSVVAIAEKILEEAKSKIRTLLKEKLPEALHQRIEADRQSGGISSDTYAAIRQALRGQLKESPQLTPSDRPQLDAATPLCGRHPHTGHLMRISDDNLQISEAQEDAE